MTIIETRGVTHRIEFRVDHVNNQPKIIHTTAPSPIEVGHQDHDPLAGRRTCWSTQRIEFKQLVEAYVWFNPHLTLRGIWFGHEFINVKATNPDWEKWRPRNPTSAHWYDEARLQRYLAAHVARDRDLGQRRTVREFIAEFRGLSGTAVQRKILDEVGCSHQSLAQFFGVDQVNRDGIAKLLAAMRKHSKPVAPKHLGVIGAEHLKQRFLAAGGNAETFKYQRRKGVTGDGIPYVVEFAFGLHQSGLGARRRRRIPQVRHRRQLERRDQQSVPPLRIDGRRTGEHAGQGARQRQPAGDLRAASGVGAHPVRRPRQELDHPHRRRGAAR